MYLLSLILCILPVTLVGLLLQWWIHSSYAAAGQVATNISGAKAAEMILQGGNLEHVPLEQSPGRHSNHYDPHRKVLRLGTDAYHGRTLAALGIAAHEAGHALQDAQQQRLLATRNLAVPAASVGSHIALAMMLLGAIVSKLALLLPAGIVLLGGVVLLQLVNLPAEYNANSRAKRQLLELGLAPENELPQLNRVLHAAALAELAATLTAVLTIPYSIVQFARQRTHIA